MKAIEYGPLKKDIIHLDQILEKYSSSPYQI